MLNRKWRNLAVQAVAGGLLAVSFGQACAANAAPFGLEVGVASCDAARAKLTGAEERSLGGQDVWLETTEAEDLYPGATKVAARCSGDRVIAVQVEASKGGMGNGGAQQAYSTLASKYKRVAGAPMPSLGDGYARFVAGNSVIEQSSPHLSFEFTVTYYEKSFYDAIKAQSANEQKNKNRKKESAL